MQSIPNFLKHGENDSILFNNKGYMSFYIPERFFTSGYAEIDGEFVKLFGLFNYALYTENDKPIGKLRLFKFPTTFLSQPGEITKERNIKLTNNNKAEDYRVLKYYTNDKVIVSTKVPKLVDNIEIFFKMFNSGIIPTGVPYDELHNLFLWNASINGYSYGVPASLIGLCISESCRAGNNDALPFRLSKSEDMNNYNLVSIKQIPNLTSAFTAMTSENWNESLANAITNKNHTDSPLEKIFMG